MPDQVGLELIAGQLAESIPGSVLRTVFFRNQASVEIAPGSVREVLAALRDVHGYRALMSVHGVDYYPQEPRLGVHYEMLDMERVDRVAVKLRVPLAAPTVPSVTADWPTADHQEREVFDMFGVEFDGHPDLRRILMPEDYEGHPQRRDFPIGGEPVLFTHNDADLAGVDPVSTRSRYRAREESITLSPLEEDIAAQRGGETTELLTLNIGPHHPATHGVLRLLVDLEGEIVRDLKPIIGYVHTGIEKTAEQKTYWKVIPDRRADGLPLLLLQRDGVLRRGRDAARVSRCRARAQYLRVIHLELNRIMSHLVWLGTSALDLGAISMFWYCFRERETILDLFEMFSGQRMHTRYFQVGGVIEDIPRGFEAKLREFIEVMPGRADQYADLLRAQRDLARATARRLPAGRADAARARRHRPAAARRRRPLGSAQGRALLVATTSSTSRSRSARSATTTTASASASPRSTSR